MNFKVSYLGFSPPLVLNDEMNCKSLSLSLFLYLLHRGTHPKLYWNSLHNVSIGVEDTLWTGTPGNYTNPNAPQALTEVRKLVDDGKYTEATEAAVKLCGDPSDVCNPVPFYYDSFVILLLNWYHWILTSMCLSFLYCSNVPGNLVPLVILLIVGDCGMLLSWVT